MKKLSSFVTAAFLALTITSGPVVTDAQEPPPVGSAEWCASIFSNWQMICPQAGEAAEAINEDSTQEERLEAAALMHLCTSLGANYRVFCILPE